MKRFSYRRQSRSVPKFLFSLCAFLLILLLFMQGISSLSDSTARRQKESLEDAIMHDITYCYTIEGTYPESLEYLKENYGLTYDEDLFFVDYRVSGSNILPDVTIIERRTDKKQ